MGLQRFSVGVTTATATAGAPLFEILPPPGKSISVVSIVGGITVATPSFYGIGRPAAKGITPGGIVLAESVSDVSTPQRKSQTQIATSWGTAPTAVSAILAHLITQGIIGGSVEWRPSRPVPVGVSLMVYNFVASAAGALFTVEFDEDV